MNDRFKFRGILTVTYGGENADDKTVDLIIEKADAIYSGDIGFDIDQLDAAIEKAGITDDIEIDQIHEFCYDNNGCRNDEYFVMDGDIEQCTGLKDKNGKLIYIGDIIKCGDGPFGTATVKYANGENFIDGIYPFDLYHDCGDECHCQLRDYPEYACEIIGNIHEQTEQKD